MVPVCDKKRLLLHVSVSVLIMHMTSNVFIIFSTYSNLVICHNLKFAIHMFDCFGIIYIHEFEKKITV